MRSLTGSWRFTVQTAKLGKPQPKRNRKGEVQPQQGEIWGDEDGQHSLILDTYEDEGDMFADVLCLSNGERWTREPFNSWDAPREDGIPYYRHLIA
jgi:hypothetical protein